ncbi:MAG: hypothetical protein LRY50_01615 [Geovibrio sp.]|nr:hypothetical protein [Geovibrio sp.]
MKKLLVILAVMLMSFACSSEKKEAATAGSAPAAAGSVLDEIVKRGELHVGLEAGYMPFELKKQTGRHRRL